ncbi:CMD domain-containing protein [Paenarthrobacter sp. NyZ202]|uniref:CMD domain-containing protein n=1 Tax=Paenarthrobacter sp. NyZ202 TaxID=3402689 RepID=UPI003CF62ED0
MKDVIDEVLGLDPSDAVWQVRRQRPEVLHHLQASYEAIHQLNGEGPVGLITKDERAAIACRVSTAAGQTRLSEHYASLISNDLVRGVASQEVEGDERLEVILRWATVVAEDPARSDDGEIDRLRMVGLTDPEIITIAQTIGFTAFQSRVVAGLEMMGV